MSLLEPVLIIVTCSHAEEARTIAKILLEKRYIACAQISSSIESMYWWDDTIEQATEVQLQLKTFSKLWNVIVKEINIVHSYDVPEIIAIPLREVTPEYEAWMQNALTPSLLPEATRPIHV